MSVNSEEKQYETQVGRLARGVGISFFGQVVSKILTYGTQVALARWYGPAQLGFYVLGFTVVQVTNILAQFGMDTSVVRSTAYHQARRDDSRVRGTLLLALGATFVLSMLLSTLVFFGAGFLAKIFNEPYLESIFRAFSVSVPFFAVMSIALWATQGFRTVKYDAYVRQLLQPLVNLVLIVVFYLFGIQILGAVFAYILSMAASSALALYYLNRVFPKLLDRSTLPKPETQAFFSVSWPMVVAKLAQYMDFWAPVAVLGIFFTAEAVGIYNTAARTAVLCSIVLMAFTGIFSPMIANLHARGLSDELGNLYKDVCRWVFVGSLAVVFFTVLLSKDIMAIFGEEFVTGWMALAIVAGAWLFDNSAGPADRILVMTGHQKLVMLIMVSYAVAGIAGSVALVPLYSIVGAAVATAAAKMSLNVGMLFFVWRRLGFWPYDYRTLKPVVAGLLAATTTLAIRQLLRLPEGFIAVLVLFIPFLASYVAILLVLGLSPSDRQLLNACWKTIKHYTPRMP